MTTGGNKEKRQMAINPEARSGAQNQSWKIVWSCHITITVFILMK